MVTIYPEANAMKDKMSSVYRKTAKAVVSGVYFIIPFAVSGGILISLAYITDSIFGADSVYGLGSALPFATILKSVGALAFSLMLPVLSGAVAVNLSDKGGFAPGIVAGSLAQNGASLELPFVDTRSASGVIGAITAGIAAGYIYKISKNIFKSAKGALRNSVKNMFLPILSVGISAFIILTINPFTGLVNTILSLMLLNLSKLNAVLFGMVLGAMTAVDMGGAFSKSAFIFATAAIASGEFTGMAAVMAAQICIPLSITLSSVIFTNKFTYRESELAKANLVFGVCGITEGSMPIMAKNPLRVIPGCVLAGAVSGGMSAGFGCTLISPFGGLLLLPVVGKPLMFLISVLAGVLAGSVAIGISKRECRKFAVNP